MIGILSFIPYYQYTCTNWQEKKSKIKSYINLGKLKRNSADTFYTDLHSNQNNYFENFLDIFGEELQQFGQEIKVDRFEINKLWTVEYHRNDYHDIHTHGQASLTGILYIDFDPEIHSSTYFVLDHIDPFTKNTIIKKSEGVKEGDFVIVPSNILHYTRPSASDIPKRVVAFDIIL